MHKFTLIGFAAVLALLPAPLLADDTGAAAGAATGAMTGAVVGGPVGAVVGAGAGAVVGGTATGPNRERVIVEERRPDCGTTSVRRENAYGDTKTVTRENC